MTGTSSTTGGGITTSSSVRYGAKGAIARAAPLLTILLVSPLMDGQALGALALVATALSISAVLGDAGFDAAATVILSRSTHAEMNAILSRLLLVRTLATCGVALPMVIWSLPNTYNGRAEIGVALLVCVGSTAASATANYRVERRVVDPQSEVSYLLFERLGVAAMFMVLVLTRLPPVIGILSANAIGPLIILSLPGPRATIARRLRANSPPAGWFCELASLAIPTGASAILSVLYWRLDVLILAHFDGPDDVGRYVLGYYPIMAAALLPGASATLILRLSPSSEASSAYFRRQVKLAVLGGFAMLSILIGPVAWVLRGPLAGLVTPPSVAVMQIAALGLPAVWVNPQLAMRLRSLGRAWSVSVVSSLALGANVLANLALIPSLGIRGCAVASVLTEVVALLGVSTLLLTRWRNRVRAEGT